MVQGRACPISTGWGTLRVQAAWGFGAGRTVRPDRARRLLPHRLLPHIKLTHPCAATPARSSPSPRLLQRREPPASLPSSRCSCKANPLPPYCCPYPCPYCTLTPLHIRLPHRRGRVRAAGTAAAAAAPPGGAGSSGAPPRPGAEGGAAASAAGHRECGWGRGMRGLRAALQLGVAPARFPSLLSRKERGPPSSSSRGVNSSSSELSENEPSPRPPSGGRNTAVAPRTPLCPPRRNTARRAFPSASRCRRWGRPTVAAFDLWASRDSLVPSLPGARDRGQRLLSVAAVGHNATSRSTLAKGCSAAVQLRGRGRPVRCEASYKS